MPPQGLAVDYDAAYARCAPDRGRLAALMLDDAYDGRLAAQYATCNAFSRQSDGSKCLADIPDSIFELGTPPPS